MPEDRDRAARAGVRAVGLQPGGPLWGVYCFNLGNQDATGADLAPSPDESLVALFRTVPECEGTSCQRPRAAHPARVRRRAGGGRGLLRRVGPLSSPPR
jgi:hypothetical protein